MYLNEFNRSRNIKISNIQKKIPMGAFMYQLENVITKKNEQLCKGGVCIQIKDKQFYFNII